MKVLLISVNRERMPYPVYPLGLAYISGDLLKYGHQVYGLDLCLTDHPKKEIIRSIEDKKPDLIGLSLRNLDNLTYPDSISYLKEAKDIVEICHKKGDLPVVIGGSGFSLSPKKILTEIKADYGIVGEGEGVLSALIRRIEGKNDSYLDNLISFEDGLLKKSLKASSFDLPDRRVFNPIPYFEQGGMINIQTKRGCPFNCIYCTYPIIEGKNLRLREISSIIDEIKTITTSFKIDYIYFVDDIFNFPPDYAKSLCKAIIDEGIKIRWTGFVNPAFFDEELATYMKKAGCAGLEFGIDSGDEIMLKNLNKRFSIEDILKASHICKKVGLPFAYYLILGGPGENHKTLKNSFIMMDKLTPTAVIAMVGIRIYPGTKLAEKAYHDGIIKKNDDLIYPKFYISKELKDEIIPIIYEEAMKRRNWIVPGLKINITQNMMEMIRRFKIKGPLWDLIGKMKRPRINPLGNERKK